MPKSEVVSCNRCGIQSSPHWTTGDATEYVCGLCEPPKGSLGQSHRTLKLVALIATAIAGFILQTCSYQKIAEQRQIGRIPQTKVVAAVPGEVNLTGRARQADQGRILNSPDTRTQCFYYRYTKEREEKDSDGDTRWVTVEDRTRYVPFDLDDTTGLMRIRPSKEVSFNIPVSHQRRSGKYRYTEYRLEPANRIFVFGFLAEKDSPVVTFQQKGDYHPLISKETELGERHSRAVGSIWLCWLGLGGFAIASSMLFSLLGFHRILVFFGMLSLIVSGALLFQGVTMMATDLTKSQSRVLRQEKVVRELIQEELGAQSIPWDGNWQTLGNLSDYRELSGKARTRLRRVRIDLATATLRSNAQAESFPYNWVRPFVGVDRPPEIPLPERDEEFRQKLETEFTKAKISGVSGIIGTVLAGLFGLGSLFFGFRKVQYKRFIENLPTTPAAGVTYGLTEAHGLIDTLPATTELRTPLAHLPAVAYHYVIKEKRGSGKNAKWVVIRDEKERIPFLCRDRSGSIPVDPTGAQVDAWRVETRREGRLQHTEKCLHLGEPVHVMGYAQLDPKTGDRLHLAQSDEPKKWSGAPFLLSGFQESHLLRRSGLAAATILNLTFAAVLFAGLMIFGVLGSFNPASYLAAALIGPLLMIGIAIAIHYNDLVFLRQRARRNWSNIDVALQKRNDLIKPLQEVAASTLEHEKTLQTKLAELRSERPNDAGDLSPELRNSHQAARDIIALAEDYPDLGAGRTLGKLAKELVQCENEIAFTSEGYNDAVETYNTRIASFPDLILAKLTGFREMPLLTHAPERIEMPKVFLG
ncbi:LemA family protein [Roseibacillus persicicus]|uniref:LemA family protein n=1 Tax=Roseibacillus persicicus TaxID=454148 RepID=UPI00280ED068|nr:LemA family protein [Roseibacillus persicicus]MDQ8191470.1 LemA family protein [Roseibacillus persicicus]